MSWWRRRDYYSIGELNAIKARVFQDGYDRAVYDFNRIAERLNNEGQPT